MIKKLGSKLKEQKGFTLIELLAVIVILGIIAAIAIPAIGKVIDNSKIDAHIANAEALVNSARIAVTDDKTASPVDGKSIVLSLKYLQTAGYLDAIKDPDGGSYDTADTIVPVVATTGTADTTYVLVTNTAGKFTYTVELHGEERFLDPKEISTIVRTDIKPIPAPAP